MDKLFKDMVLEGQEKYRLKKNLSVNITSQ